MDLLPLTTWAGPVPSGVYARFFKGYINDLAVSKDGKRLAVVGPIGVYTYAADTFEPRWKAALPEAQWSADFSPDGQLLATGGFGNGKIILWNADTGTPIREFTHPGGLVEVAFSPDGKILASISVDEHYIMLWDVADGRKVDSIGAECIFVEIVFSPDGTIIACVTNDFTVALLDAANGKTLRILDPKSEWVDDIRFSPDGKTVATMGLGTVILWDVQTGNRLRTLPKVSMVTWSPSGKLLLSWDWQGSIKVWDSTGGALLRTVSELKGADYSYFQEIFFLSDDDSILAKSPEGLIFICNLAKETVVRTIEDFTSGTYDIAFSPDGRTMAMISSTGYYRWDVSQRADFPSVGDPLNRIMIEDHYSVISQDGNTLASSSGPEDQERILLTDLATGKQIRWMGLPRKNYELAFSPDGSILASADPEGEMVFWEVSTGQRLRTMQTNDPHLWYFEFSSDGSRLAAASYTNGAVMVWDVSSGELIASFGGGYDSRMVIGFSPAGPDLYFKLTNHTLMHWDGIVGHPATECRRFTDDFEDIEISPDGKMAALSLMTYPDEKGILNITRLSGEGGQWTFVGSHNRPIWRMAFSPDGRTIASSSLDGTVVLWEVKE